ncbi:MAG TPA: 2-oxoglutarate dehydrogenase E1 component, partial [Cellvibrionaceae bacterium]|nr:2-oxoglutarate dehydrogenase E1 component [Cellvibrionaceae bacterium]
MQNNLMELLWGTSHISGGNAAYVEEVYEAFLRDPSSVSSDWRDYFEKLPQNGHGGSPDVPHSEVIEYFELLGKNRARPLVAPGSGAIDVKHERKQVELMQLINAYRLSGHKKAKLDPLGLQKPATDIEELDLHFHGLTNNDLDLVFQTGDLSFGKAEASLREIVSDLEKTYCGTIGAEVMHITRSKERRWLLSRLESSRAKAVLSPEAKRALLERLTAAEGLERHLDSKY